MRSLDARIFSIKKAITQSDPRTAGGQFRLLTGDLAAQRGRHLNENAFSLFKAAADFLAIKLGPVDLK